MGTENEGPISEAFSTREADTNMGGDEAETLNVEPVAPAEPTVPETRQETEWERTVREQQADATRKWQEAAENRRLVEQRQRDLEARERALRAQEEALAPLREFDALVEQNPDLRATVAAHLTNYRPGTAKYATDEFVTRLNQNEQQLQSMALTYARTLMGQKYGDFSANEEQIARTCEQYGLLRPGMTAEQIVRGLDAGYQLTQRPKMVEQTRQQSEEAEKMKQQAAKVGAGGNASRPSSPPTEMPTRHADGSLMSYDDLAEMAKGRLR